MKNKRVIFLGVITTIVLSGCVSPTPTTVTYGINKSLIHPFKSGDPVPAKNEWVTVKNAEGVQMWFDWDLRAHLAWDFLVILHNPNITKIEVYDITDSPTKLTLKQSNFSQKKSYWTGWSEEHLITKQSDKWLYQTGDTIKVFKFVIYQSNESKELLQPVRITQRKKTEFNEATAFRNLVYERTKNNPNSNTLIFE